MAYRYARINKETGEIMSSEIDPIQFGALTAQVATLEMQVTELQADMKLLLALANKSSGGLWVGMSIASALGGLATWDVFGRGWARRQWSLISLGRLPP